MVDVRPVVEGVPAVVGGFLGIVRAHGRERALPVKVQAVGAGVRIHAVQNDPDAPLVGSVAESGKIRLGAEKRVGGFVVAGVVAVAGKTLGNGVEVENGDAKTGDVVHFLGDAPEIAAEKVVVQNLTVGSRLPVHLIVPVLMNGVGLQLSGQVGLAAGVEAVGKYLINGRALRPVRGGEIRGDAAQLPEVTGLHVGVVSLLEQAEAAALSIDDEIVEKQAGEGDGKLPLENVIRALFHLECQSSILRPGAVLVIKDAGDLRRQDGGGNMDMQGADLPRRQGSEGGLELGLLAVVKDSHGGLLVVNSFFPL